MNRRLADFNEWLKEHNHDAAFITSTPNIFYLSGFYSDPHERLIGLLLFHNHEPVLVCPKMEKNQAKNTGWLYEIIAYDDIDDPWNLIIECIKNRNITADSIAIEKSHLNIDCGEQLYNVFPSASFVNAEEKLKLLRMIKDEKEISILREAGKFADFGIEVGVNSISAGKNEMEILAAIEFELKKKGIRDMSFSTMVLSGKKTASPHGTPGLKTIQKGDFILFDLGVVLDGYCSDITRTVVFGEPTDDQKEIYHTVLKAQQAAVQECKPGVKIGLIDQTARNLITKAGFGSFFIHRIGHGLGIEVHEFPSMTSTNEDELKTGMTFTVEPGIYVPSIGGVRIEDDLLITDNGVESFTQYPKDLQAV